MTDMNVLARADDGILVMSLETRTVAFANAPIERMLGYAKGALHDAPMSSLVLEQALARVTEQFDLGAQGELTSVQDLPLLNTDGEVVFTDVNGGPVEIGGRRFLVGVFRDATQRRAGEEALRLRLEELQRWQALQLDREDRVLDLKREVNELLEQSQRPPRYSSVK